MWLCMLLNPLVLCWVLSYCISSFLSSYVCNYVDISSIIPHLFRNPLNILVVLILFFFNLPQKCWAFLCIMVCYTTIHACRRWKWTFPCIVSYTLIVMAYYWTFSSSKSSSTSSSTSASSSFSSWCIILRHLIILHEVILWLHVIILRLCSVVWRWYLVELRCILSCHHFLMHPIGI
jgi:hypothetical protein